MNCDFSFKKSAHAPALLIRWFICINGQDVVNHMETDLLTFLYMNNVLVKTTCWHPSVSRDNGVKIAGVTSSGAGGWYGDPRVPSARIPLSVLVAGSG